MNSESITLRKINEITGLPIPKEMEAYLDETISEVSLGARDLKKGCILFHLADADLEEHNIGEIREKASFIVSKEPFDGVRTILCRDPNRYGREFMGWYKSRFNVRTVAVTGSVGKTSTKEMIEAALKTRFGEKMLVSIGNSNSSFKVCYNIKKLNGETEVYLQEVGAGSGRNNTVKDSAVQLNADIIVYTNIRDNHIEWYGSRKKIAKEKFTLSDYGKRDGLAVINYDDPILRKHRFPQRTVTYALNNPKADYYAEEISVNLDGTDFILIDSGSNRRIPVHVSVIGEHNVLNAMAAYIVGKSLGETEDEILTGIGSYETKGPRQNIIDVGKYRVFADCYNSSYDALANILKTLDVLETKGRKICVIGDILELGRISENTHREVGRLLAQHEPDHVFFSGEESRYSYEEYIKIRDNAEFCETRLKLRKSIQSYIKKDDIILFKASHGMHFAELIDTMFGLEIGEKTALGHGEYETVTEGEFGYNVFDNHATLTRCTSESDIIEIPERVSGKRIEKIGLGVFKNSSTIKNVILPDGIVSLRGGCFDGSTLESITFGNRLKKIGANSFRGSKLKEAVVPSGTLMIKKGAFADIETLTAVYLPRTCQDIASSAFDNCPNLVLYVKDGSYAKRYAKKKEIPYEIID